MSNGKNMWSDVQWSACQPIVRDANGHVRNCCALCSQEVGYYFTTQVQCAPAASWSIQELRTRYVTSVEWLKFNIPCGFWDKFHDHLAELDRTHRGAIVQRNIMAGLSEQKSLVKWMSYDGALCLTVLCLCCVSLFVLFLCVCCLFVLRLCCVSLFVLFLVLFVFCVYMYLVA